ncbi:MAG: hypothetical protein RR190_02910 [Bacteroidales bacterium]
MKNQDFFSNAPEQPMTMGNWLITLLLMAIPLVNFILLFIWAFGTNTNTSKSNWAKASLVLMAICLCFGFLFYGSIYSFFSPLI